MITKVQKDAINYADLHAEYVGSGHKWTDPKFPPDSTSIGEAELAFVPRWVRVPEVIKGACFKVNRI